VMHQVLAQALASRRLNGLDVQLLRGQVLKKYQLALVENLTRQEQ